MGNDGIEGSIRGDSEYHKLVNKLAIICSMKGNDGAHRGDTKKGRYLYETGGSEE